MIWVMPASSLWSAWSALAADAPKDESGEALAFLNVGTGVDCTIKQLAEQVRGNRLLAPMGSRKPDGTPKKQLDVSRLKALGWSAQIPLNQDCRWPLRISNKLRQAQLIRQR